MRIESCPFCGGEVRFDLGDLSAKCSSCFYTGPTDDNEAAAHNRLSRIVRAAEAWAKAVRYEEEATSGRRCVPSKTQLDAQDWVTEAEDALLVAVEGSRDDGQRHGG